MTELRYDTSDHGIDTSPDAAFRWQLRYAARISRTAARRGLINRLIDNFGNWTERERKSAYIAAGDGLYAWREMLAERSRDASVRRFIASVGCDAAREHARDLRRSADRLLQRESDGREYADSYDRYSDRYWAGCRNSAAAMREKADRIDRHLSAAR